MEQPPRRVYVWDLPVRLTHWGLFIAIALAWISAQLGFEWRHVHTWSGYTVIVLVGFRLLWGVLGSETARFADFLAGPRTVWRYVRGWRRQAATLGHNPLGGWAVVVLLAAALLQAAAGLFATDDILYSGPLNGAVGNATADALGGLHTGFVNTLLALIALHVLAIAVYRLVRRENLLRPMITGYKPDGTYQPWTAPLYRALALLAAVAGALALLLWAVGS